jgi:outer membrane protein assembly factor BamD (BamD/ComL family)
VVAALYEAAQADEALRRWEEARKLYRTIISDYESGEYQQKAQERLKAIEGKE